MNDYGKFIMVGCPVFGTVVLLVIECNLHPFSFAHFLYKSYIFSSSLITFVISLLLLCYYFVTFMNISLSFNWGCKNTFLYF